MSLDLNILFDKQIFSECFVSIVVPVKDEADYLLKSLTSLVNQIDLQNKPLDKNIFEILILANNCRDDSFEIARQWQRQNHFNNLHVAEIFLLEEHANIGFVRRLLMSEAARRLKSNKFNGGIILTTDGDTLVAPDWIAQNMLEIERGADAVGGRILMENEELAKLDAQTKNFYFLDEEYRLLVAEIECLFDYLPHNHLPRHHQNFNGSFAVTTDAFERAGGIPNVKFLEDVAFYNSLLRIDAKFRHSPNVRVFTSARNAGRVALGLSTQLNKWQIMGRKHDIYFVESAQSIERRILSRKRLRELWQCANRRNLPLFNEVAPVAEHLAVSAKWLFNEIRQSQNFGVLLEKIFHEQRANDDSEKQNFSVPIAEAISDLKARLGELRLENKFFDKTA